MATRLTVTAKGQVTLRRELLRHLGLSTGDRIIVDLLPDGRAEIRAAKGDGEIDGFFGCLTAVRSADPDADQADLSSDKPPGTEP